jgi:hypothetical protein
MLINPYMRWVIEGANRENGREQVITVEARSPAEAEQIAAQRGLLVAKLTGHPVASAANLLGRMLGEKKPPILSTPFKARNGGSPAEPAAPAQYLELTIGRSVALVLAILCYVTAGAVLVGAAATVSSASRAGEYFRPLAFLGAAMGACVLGALLHAISTACAVLRDIVRNNPARS